MVTARRGIYILVETPQPHPCHLILVCLARLLYIVWTRPCPEDVVGRIVKRRRHLLWIRNVRPAARDALIRRGDCSVGSGIQLLVKSPRARLTVICTRRILVTAHAAADRLTSRAGSAVRSIQDEPLGV